MKTTTIYQIEEADFNQAIEKAMQKHVSNIAYSRFEGRKVSSQVACAILNVSQRTLYRYVSAGFLTAEDRNENEDYKFDLRMLLEFNVLKHKRTSTWRRSASS